MHGLSPVPSESTFAEAPFFHSLEQYPHSVTYKSQWYMDCHQFSVKAPSLRHHSSTLGTTSTLSTVCLYKSYSGTPVFDPDRHLLTMSSEAYGGAGVNRRGELGGGEEGLGLGGGGGGGACVNTREGTFSSLQLLSPIKIHMHIQRLHIDHVIWNFCCCW